jgi:hypothetical protein
MRVKLSPTKRLLRQTHLPSGIGGDAAALEVDMLDVSFDRWLAGEDLPIAHLQGQLGGLSKPIDWPPRPARKKAEKSHTISR